jgi:hypothetical protein
MFKQATKNKYRFQTARGAVNTEDLWDIPETQLKSVARNLKTQLKEQAEDDLFETRTKEDAITQAKFDIVMAVYHERMADKAKAVNAKEVAAEKQKLLALIDEKENEELRGLSAEELRKKLSELG